MRPPTLLFRLLLRSYPAPFRKRYGADMEEAFVVSWEGTQGTRARGTLLARAAGDLISTGLRERLSGRGYRRGRSPLRIPTRGVSVLLRDLWQDTRYAARTLAATPGYVAVLVLTVALGLGANTAIFSVAYGVLGRPLPFANGPQLVRLVQERPGYGADDSGTREVGFSVHEIHDYARVPGVGEVAEYHRMTFTLQAPGGPLRAGAGVVSSNFFSFLGMRPLHGRLFDPAEDRLGTEPVLVLSHEFWQGAFGGDPEVVGTRVRMNGADHEIVGILPPIPQFPDRNDIYLPVSVCPTRSSPDFIADRERRMMTAYARLEVGWEVERAREEVARFGATLTEAHPGAYDLPGGFAASLVPLDEELVRTARPVILALAGVAGLLLVIACANAASLALARASRRWEQASIREALGASRGRMVRQHVTEGLLLGLLGGVVGLAVALVGHDLLAAFASRFTTRAQQIALDGQVLAFALGASLLTGLVLGLSPLAALRHPRALAGGAPVKGEAQRARRWQRRLVVLQVAVAFVVLSGAGLMLRSLWALSVRDTGLTRESVLTARVSLDEARFQELPAAEAFLKEVAERLARHPQVLEVTRLPWAPLAEVHEHRSALYLTPPGGGEERIPAVGDVRPVDPSTFRVLGVPVVEGRGVLSSDGPGAPEVAVVNETFQRRFMGGDLVLGSQVRSCDAREGCSDPVEIVGVVGDVRSNGVDAEVIPEVYVPAAQSNWLREVVAARVTGDPGTVRDALAAVVREMDPQTPLTRVATLEEFRRENLAPRRFTTVLLLLFAGVAGGLAVAGVFGITHLMAAARMREMGVRRALGARPGEVARQILREGTAVVVVGLLAGGAAVWWTNRLLARFLWGVEPYDPLTLVASALLFLGAGVAAAAIPARRAGEDDVLRTLSAP